MSAWPPAWLPLRTAPSMVAGHPVSVHAPARKQIRQAGPRTGPPRQAARGLAKGGLVLARDVEPAHLRPACAAGNTRASSPRNCSRKASVGNWAYAPAPESETASAWPSVSPAAAVRSNTHCTGVPTPAANGVGHHRPVVDHVQVYDWHGAQLGEARRVWIGGRRHEARRLRVRHRQHHRVGRQVFAHAPVCAVPASGLSPAPPRQLGPELHVNARRPQRAHSLIAMRAAQGRGGVAQVGCRPIA